MHFCKNNDRNFLKKKARRVRFVKTEGKREGRILSLRIDSREFIYLKKIAFNVTHFISLFEVSYTKSFQKLFS